MNSPEVKVITVYVIYPEQETIVAEQVADDGDAFRLILGGWLEEHTLAGGSQGRGDMLLVDEEGALKGHKHAFALSGLSPHQYVGKGLICGCTHRGDTAPSPSQPLEHYRKALRYAHAKEQ